MLAFFNDSAYPDPLAIRVWEIQELYSRNLAGRLSVFLNKQTSARKPPRNAGRRQSSEKMFFVVVQTTTTHHVSQLC
jgi:hypothetical protein